MDLETARNMIEKHMRGHTDFVGKCMVAERYYRNDNDINHRQPKKDEEENLLHRACNKVPRNFHGFLVNQKASYLFTYPPLFDVGNKAVNDKISDILGDKYPKVAKNLCVNASNDSISWLHYWVNDKGEFKYAIVDSKQVIPIHTQDLEEELESVLRCYEVEEADGKYDIYEIWTDTQCETFRKKTSDGYDTIVPDTHHFPIFELGSIVGESNIYNHGFGEVPFIEFRNNNIGTSDLVNIKPLIDAYDKVFTGFVDDIDDLQEIVLVLKGYGGTDLDTLLADLKKYKTINTDEDGGVDALKIEIPVDAREKVLEIARKAIFEQGQGVDPDREDFGNASGVALQFIYSLLELKAGLMETEFREPFGKLVRAICRHLGVACGKIDQTWTRNAVRNDSELVTMCQASVGVVSKETIVKNHPFVQDPEKEIAQIKKEKQEEMDLYGEYNMHGNQMTGGGSGEE